MMQESGGSYKRKGEKESFSDRASTNEPKSPVDAGKIEAVVQNQISRIRNELVCAVTLPFLALLGIGSSPTLYALAFGSVASYVMDLLESLEVSLFFCKTDTIIVNDYFTGNYGYICFNDVCTYWNINLCFS